MSDEKESQSTAGGLAGIAAGGAATVFLLFFLTAHPSVVRSGEEITQRIAQAGLSENSATAPAVDSGRPSNQPGVDVDILRGGTASELVHVPVGKLYPGAVLVNPTVHNPAADDPAAVQRGMRYFNQFNCVGCHAPNGGGGMGPSLSNSKFIYGSEPENIYLSILQGRPNGMPTWGGMLPDNVIWDLVAYVRAISKEPAGPWGKTVSADGFKIEQVPAEFLTTTEPWKHTTPFSYGQAPFEKPKGSPPLETPKN